MSSPMTWWANRKSKLGLQPSAKAPPHLPGKEWWTTPPTTIPQPEHIEYVIEFRCRALMLPEGSERNQLLACINEWLKAARRLLHEEMRSPDRADLNTTDGLLIACDDAIRDVILTCHKAGVRLDQRVIDLHTELRRRCTSLRRERAIESSKTVSRVYWDPSKSNGGQPPKGDL